MDAKHGDAGQNAIRVSAILDAVGRERTRKPNNFPSRKPVAATCKRAQTAIAKARRLDADVRKAQCALATLRARCETAHMQAIAAIDMARDILELAK